MRSYRAGSPRRPVLGGRTGLLLLVVALAVASACSREDTNPDQPGARAPVASTPGAVPRPDHVLVVVFENKGYDQVVGSSEAPYLTGLAHAGANLVDAHGETHPSQPNYIALLSGATQGVRNDSCPQALGGAPTLASQLTATGHASFGGYSEGLPAPGFTGCASSDGRYAAKHNPWVDFASTPAGANQPLSAMPRDYASLPTVSFLVPDMCHDMHDCPVPAGDAWAREHLAPYLAWAGTHNSMLIVTFDEDDNTTANHIPTLLVGPMVRAGDVPERADHYTLLRTLEDAYGLPALGAAATTPPLTGIWAR